MSTVIRDLHYDSNWAKTSANDEDLEGGDISLDDVDVGKDLTAFISSPHAFVSSPHSSTESHPPEEVMTAFSSKHAHSRISRKARALSHHLKQAVYLSGKSAFMQKLRLPFLLLLLLSFPPAQHQFKYCPDFKKCLSKWMVATYHHPLHCVEDKHFRAMCQSLNPKAPMLTSDKLKKLKSEVCHVIAELKLRNNLRVDILHLLLMVGLLSVTRLTSLVLHILLTALLGHCMQWSWVCMKKMEVQSMKILLNIV
jgi:hypothetical protein